MVFCNHKISRLLWGDTKVTILILVDGFLQYFNNEYVQSNDTVTILILVDGFLQYEPKREYVLFEKESHNPYFSRWFSAIQSDFIKIGFIDTSQSLF